MKIKKQITTKNIAQYIFELNVEIELHGIELHTLAEVLNRETKISCSKAYEQLIEKLDTIQTWLKDVYASTKRFKVNCIKEQRATKITGAKGKIIVIDDPWNNEQSKTKEKIKKINTMIKKHKSQKNNKKKKCIKALI